MKLLTVCIPCFNEGRTISPLIDKVLAADSLGLKKEIIVIDDGSTDNIVELLDKLVRAKKISLISFAKNKGKGRALKEAFLKSSGDIVLVQDGDLEYDPDDYPALLEPIISGKADVVYGSRFLGGRPHRVVYFWHSVMNTFLTTLSNILTNINLTDMETCYKVMKGDIARQIATKIESNRFGFEPEVTARLSKIRQIRFYEVGVSYYGRTYDDGKHIRWTDGLIAVWQIIKYNVFSK